MIQGWKNHSVPFFVGFHHHAKRRFLGLPVCIDEHFSVDTASSSEETIKKSENCPKNIRKSFDYSRLLLILICLKRLCPQVVHSPVHTCFHSRPKLTENYKIRGIGILQQTLEFEEISIIPNAILVEPFIG